MKDLTAEFAVTCDKLLSIDIANQIRIVSYSCFAPKLVDWVLILQRLTRSSFTTVIGTRKMICRPRPAVIVSVKRRWSKFTGTIRRQLYYLFKFSASHTAFCIFRLLTRNTYEREMFDKASLKLGLDKAVLQSMNTTQGGKDYGGSGKQPLSKKEIEDLLKKGAYGALMEDDNAGDKFCEEDIDQILMRRTQIITLESEKGSQFSKATFASNSDRTDIDIDDPDFWKKWAKRAEIDTESVLTNGQEELLVLSEPRRRTQIKRYGQVWKRRK